MNNRGFTLVEIIVVIVLISAIAGIFTVNMTNILQSVKDSEETRLSTDVELAADAWINSSKEKLANIPNCSATTTIYTSNLIGAGYLKEVNGINYPDSISVCKQSNGVLKFS